MGSIQTEVEASLLIAGDDPSATLADLAALQSVVGYALVPSPALDIHDRYLDTADRALLAHRFSLRVRKADGNCLLTLKGDTPTSEVTLKVRAELELPWSQDALQRVLAEMSRQGVVLRPMLYADADPLAVLRGGGLRVIQERMNRRLIREARSAGGDLCAEIALDAVTFCLRSGDVRHYEVEIERKGGGAPDDIYALAAGFLACFPGRLQPWSIAKLSLGVLLEELDRQGRLKALLTDDGRLHAAGYDAIRQAANAQSLP